LSWMRRVWLAGPPIADAIFLFGLSAQESLPDTPGGDKLAHVVAYTILGLLIARAFGGLSSLRGARLAAVAFVLGALYGLSDEYHQSLVPGRDAEWGDVLADACGSLIGSTGWAISVSRAVSERVLRLRLRLRGGSPPEGTGP
jgi:VanZ family protein